MKINNNLLIVLVYNFDMCIRGVYEVYVGKYFVGIFYMKLGYC